MQDKLAQITQPLDVVDHKPIIKKPQTEAQKAAFERGKAKRLENIKLANETKKNKTEEKEAKGEPVIYNKPHSVSSKILKHDAKLDMVLDKISTLENSYKKVNTLEVPAALIEKDKPLPPPPEPVPQEEINKPEPPKKEPENPVKPPEEHKKFLGQYNIKKYTSFKGIKHNIKPKRN